MTHVKISQVRFIVVGNLLCSEHRIHRRYDLKGSSYGRKSDRFEEEETGDATTLKDLHLNFAFRMQRSWYKELHEYAFCPPRCTPASSSEAHIHERHRPVPLWRRRRAGARAYHVFFCFARRPTNSRNEAIIVFCFCFCVWPPQTILFLFLFLFDRSNPGVENSDQVLPLYRNI